MLRFSNYPCDVIWNPDIEISMLCTRHKSAVEAHSVHWDYGMGEGVPHESLKGSLIIY